MNSNCEIVTAGAVAALVDSAIGASHLSDVFWLSAAFATPAKATKAAMQPPSKILFMRISFD
jgi:hypothetical protein